MANDAPDEGEGKSNAELVERIRAGDSSAEDELVRRFGRGLRIILRRSSREPSAIDDLYQDAFRIAIEKIRRGDLREPERLPGFLASLAGNLVVEHFRKRSRRAPESGVEEGPEIPDRAKGPLDVLLGREAVEIVRQVLSELDSERDRQILFRFYLAEEDKSTICQELDLSSVHFNRVLFRARERYRELYKRMTAPRRGGITGRDPALK